VKHVLHHRRECRCPDCAKLHSHFLGIMLWLATVGAVAALWYVTPGRW